MVESAPRTARERARREITADIIRVGRQHLARDGAAALSLRAVARDLGMVSSAMYRYVPNRDALLTLLIVDAYDSLGAAVEAADASAPPSSILDRFLATCHAVREWALANPHEYALIYGSPVPGYAAPESTIGPASRATAVLLSILADAPAIESGTATAPPPVRAAIAPLRTLVAGHIPDDLLLVGLNAGAALLGQVSLELFGHTRNVVADDPEHRRAYFEHEMRAVGDTLTRGRPAVRPARR